MASLNARIPSYRLHKPSGLAVVRLGGKDIYLGRHGTAASREDYRRVVAEWLASGVSVDAAGGPGPAAPASASADPCVNEIVLGYLDHAESYYVKGGRPTGEIDSIKASVRPLAALYGRTAASSFGPLGLKAVRESMIDAGLCRTVVNSRVNRIRRMFKWAVENQLVPASVLHGLQAVAPLKRGRSRAPEPAPVTPASRELVDAVLEVAPPQIAAMVRLQLLTGMRPGEVVRLRTCDLCTEGPVWIYRPAEHKTEHHGRARLVHIGPQAQEVLRPWLRPRVDEHLFRPVDVMEWTWARRRERRLTPLTPSQRGRRCRGMPQRVPGERYDTHSYARAITYACDQAFPHPALEGIKPRDLTAEQRAELKRWRDDHRWSPNQLRHTAATALRKQFGIEAARVVLGHGSAQVTEIYAEQDFGLAKEIMARVG